MKQTAQERDHYKILIQHEKEMKLFLTNTDGVSEADKEALVRK